MTPSPLLKWFVLAGYILLSAGRFSHAQPPPAQLYLGAWLNDLLKRFEGVRLPDSPEPPAKLSTKAHRAIAILAPGGLDASFVLRVPNVKWPVALTEAPKKKDRVIASLSTVLAEARKGKVSVKSAGALEAALKQLVDDLQERVADVPPGEYIAARRFTNRLQQAVKTMDRAGLGNDLALADKAAAEGKTIPDLVRFMLAKKLKFAPVVPGEEEGYRELHTALAAYQRKVPAGRK